MIDFIKRLIINFFFFSLKFALLYKKIENFLRKRKKKEFSLMTDKKKNKNELRNVIYIIIFIIFINNSSIC